MATNQSATILLRAYTLAKAKRYSQAEALILSDLDVAKTAPAMDLLARLRIEQKDPIEARRLWEEILTTTPDYAPALQALKHFDRKPPLLTKQRCTYLLMFVLFLGGLLLGWSLSPCQAPQPSPLQPKTYTYERLPRYADLQALQPHRGNIHRILIASHLFADPKAIARRQNLLESLTHLLDLPADRIYFAAQTATAPQERITLTIEPKIN